MAHIERNFRTVSDVYDLNSDEREFRASADILNDFSLAVFSKRLATAMQNAGLEKAKIRRVNGVHTRGWFVPPKLLAVGNNHDETPAQPETLATPAPQIQPTALAQLPMELVQPEAVEAPTTAYSDASATQSVDLYERTDQPQEAPEDAVSASDKIAGDTHSGIDAILAAVNTPIVAEGFDLTKRPPGIRMIKGSAEAFAPFTFRPFDYLEAINECRAYLDINDNEKLIHALAFASVGIRVFPVWPLTKIPQIPEWQQRATSKYDSIEEWFSSGDANIGVATGATEGGYELVVVDIDTKNGAVGFKGLEELETTLAKLPETLTAVTPSGGEHRYYRVRQGLGVASRKLTTAAGEAVGDFQAKGKLVVAPPSVFADKKDGNKHKLYKWKNDLGIAELPEAWLTPKVAIAVPKSVSNGNSSAGVLITGQEALEALDTLNYINPDIDHDDWVEVTALLHNVEGGHEAWLEWTRRGEKFDPAKDEAKWDEVASLNLTSCGSVGKLFALAKANPSYVNPKSREAQQRHDIPEGLRQIEGSEEAFANTTELAELPSVQTLLDSITTKAAKSQGAWLAHAVLSADEERVKAYQLNNPTTSNGKPRKLLANDGSVEWSAATYTAAMHTAGEVLILQANHSISAVSELSQVDAGKVTGLVHDLFKACPIAHVWAAIPTTKNVNMHKICVSAVWKARIQRQGEALSNNPAVGNTPAVQPAQPVQPPVHSGFDLSKPPSSLTGRVEAVAPVPPAQPPVYAGFDLSKPPDSLTGKANGVVSSGVLSPAATGITAVPVPAGEVVPVTIGSVASLPPKRRRGDDLSTDFERLRAALAKHLGGVWFVDAAEDADEETTNRYFYARTDGGWYKRVSVSQVKQTAFAVKDAEGIPVTASRTVEDATNNFMLTAQRISFSSAPHLIPMEDGVLDIETKDVYRYAVMRPFKWHLPYRYEPSAQCPTWLSFINKQMEGDAGRVKTIQAFLRCLVSSYYQIQRYLEVVGAGGSGKGEFVRVCRALVGDMNTVDSSLSKLDPSKDSSRFATLPFKDKKLIIFADQDKYYGGGEIFRKITGGDNLDNEKKHQQSGAGFVYEGLVIVTANSFINPKSSGGAILRRRVPVKFDVVVTEEEKAAYDAHANIGSYMINNELSGILNWVLAIPLDEALAQLRNPDPYTKRLNGEVEDGNNPVRAWLRDEVVSCGRGEETLIGSDIRDHAAVNSPEWGMYASYCDYCRGAGNVPVNRKSFVDMILTETRGKGVEHKKERVRGSNYNKWILSGLRLRKDSDD